MLKKWRAPKFTIVLLAAGLLLLDGITPRNALGWSQSGQAELTIYYSASLKGNLNGCNCIKVRRAGLVKRVFFLRRLSRQNNIILVDAGDLLPNRSGDKLRADYFFKIYRELNYDAIGLGDNELLNGVLEYQANCPLLANNLPVRLPVI